jgi:hypothetical protein
LSAVSPKRWKRASWKRASLRAKAEQQSNERVFERGLERMFANVIGAPELLIAPHL